MAIIYAKEKTKEQLQMISENQHRDVSDELDLLVSRRLIELGLTANLNAPSKDDVNLGNLQSQEENKNA